METLVFPPADLPCGISILHQTSVRETHALHRHDFYEFFYVMCGRAMHHINGENECCAAGMLVLIRPDDAHWYSFINHWDMELVSVGIIRPIMAEVLAFTGIEESALTKGRLPPRIVLNTRDASSLSQEVLRLENTAAPEMRRQFGKTLLARLLIDLTEDVPEPVCLPAWLSTLLTDMSKPDNFRAGLKRMVEMSHVSQNHLNREMKRCLGLTPTEFINAKRIALAGNLLLTGEHSVTEVAGLCGFETLSHFYDNFRKIEGCSPREFTVRHRRKE